MAVRESELDDYLETAAALFDGRLAEAELPPAVANLPAIDQQRVEQLAAMAAEAAFTQPKYGWALTAVAAAAADCIEDTFLQALAAWLHLAGDEHNARNAALLAHSSMSMPGHENPLMLELFGQGLRGL